MTYTHTSRRRLALLLGMMAATAGCGASPIEALVTARELSIDLFVQFTVAADASNKAVMADTLDVSTTFAQQAQRAKSDVQSTVTALGAILRDHGYTAERDLLNRFEGDFGRYRELDQQILDLTIENSNRKAEWLSYSEGRQNAESVGQRLAALKAGADRDSWQVKALALEALSAVREIVALQPQHIREPSDAAMTDLEKQMASAEGVARGALQSLRALVSGSSRADLEAATGALDRFMATNAEVITLSRRNTNVRSRALTLTEKARLTAACESQLIALRTALAERGRRATR